VSRLHIDAARVPPDCHFFRIECWPIALVVSQAVRDRMERAGCLGARFEALD
jgi:hypothetical protein